MTPPFDKEPLLLCSYFVTDHFLHYAYVAFQAHMEFRKNPSQDSLTYTCIGNTRPDGTYSTRLTPAARSIRFDAFTASESLYKSWP